MPFGRTPRRIGQLQPYASAQARPLRTRQAQVGEIAFSQVARSNASGAGFQSPRYDTPPGHNPLVLGMTSPATRHVEQPSAKFDQGPLTGLWPALPESPEPELELEDELVAGGNIEAAYLLWERRQRLDREQEGLRWSV
ncbi:MAG: hypothetical protein M3441_09540 [Chloroflexota bacterium]|nr:hypothetical protein [Chloroflexota bacterium]